MTTFATSDADILRAAAAVIRTRWDDQQGKANDLDALIAKIESEPVEDFAELDIVALRRDPTVIGQVMTIDDDKRVTVFPRNLNSLVARAQKTDLIKVEN